MISLLGFIIGLALVIVFATGIYSYVRQVKKVDAVISHEADVHVWGMPPNTFLLSFAIIILGYLAVLLFPYKDLYNSIHKTDIQQNVKIDSLESVIIYQSQKIIYLDSLLNVHKNEIQKIKNRQTQVHPQRMMNISIGRLHVSSDSVRASIK